MLTWTIVSVTLASTLGSILVPQQHLLIDARNAICAGDRAFVYTIDGAGSVAWAYPPDWETSDEANAVLPYPWIEVDELPSNYNEALKSRPILTFQEEIVDLVLAEYGRARVECEAVQCYLLSSPIPVPLRPPAGTQAKCCLPRQTKVPSVAGGKFSLVTKSTESTAAATAMCALLTACAPAPVHTFPPCFLITSPSLSLPR